MPFDFSDPDLHLPNADARQLAAVLSAASDLALVLDGRDVIRDVSHNLDRQAGARLASWRGLAVEEVVRDGSRTVLRRALRRTRGGERVGGFDVTHVGGAERDLPVRYTALGLGGDGGIVLVGRDLRPVADLQMRLLESRQSLEERAVGQKQAEAQYRLLFETAADAIVIVEAGTGRIREANPRAARLLGMATGAGGRRFDALFAKPQQAAVRAVLAGVAASGAASSLRVDLPGGAATLSVDLFRAGDLRLLMLRLAMLPETGADPASPPPGGVESLVRNAAEAVVLTDEEGSVLWANEAFLGMAAIPLAAHAVARPIGDFLQWSGVGPEVLLETARRHGRVPAFAAELRGAGGRMTAVDVSAVAMPGGTPPGFGFVMRALPDEAARQGNSDLTRTAEGLVEMIGRVPMKDLVRDTTDVIERMCIEAALKLTGDNRASAARVLGLSRQALYLKMHRFGLADAE